MGANMVRRLKDQGFEVTAVFDSNAAAAAALAAEIGSVAPATLPEVTSAADIIITVVSDDEAMDDIFGSVGCGCDSLLGTASGVTVAEGRLFIIARPFRPARTSSWRAARRPPERNRWRPAWRPASPRRARARSI